VLVHVCVTLETAVYYQQAAATRCTGVL
jgi:hypothetical protein